MNNGIVLSKSPEFSVEKICVTVLGAIFLGAIFLGAISAPQPEQDQVAANESGENAQISLSRFEIVYQ